MIPDKMSLNLDSKFIRTMFELADLNVPDEVTSENLSEALSKIKIKINNFSLNKSVNDIDSQAEKMIDAASGSSDRPKTVLIVDDLGIITYQLDIIFKKMNFEVTIAQEIYDAIEKYKKQDYGYAVIDLFIPTEREGFILLDELKKLALLCKLNTKIIVMTASSKNEYKTKCLNRGADYYIEKAPGWQKKIMEACVEK